VRGHMESASNYHTAIEADAGLSELRFASTLTIDACGEKTNKCNNKPTNKWVGLISPHRAGTKVGPSC
jgi:hypothetical protein